mmetsp:Transcript_17666/g.33770  ORF Transcript_17666/g.33770 Transcript_17666/m.33770 type:complete len:250 (-) Transcript_17666:8-757(-)
MACALTRLWNHSGLECGCAHHHGPGGSGGGGLVVLFKGAAGVGLVTRAAARTRLYHMRISVRRDGPAAFREPPDSREPQQSVAACFLGQATCPPLAGRAHATWRDGSTGGGLLWTRCGSSHAADTHPLRPWIRGGARRVRGGHRLGVASVRATSLPVTGPAGPPRLALRGPPCADSSDVSLFCADSSALGVEISPGCSCGGGGGGHALGRSGGDGIHVGLGSSSLHRRPGADERSLGDASKQQGASQRS